jgi:hypothetical protein
MDGLQLIFFQLRTGWNLDFFTYTRVLTETFAVTRGLQLGFFQLHVVCNFFFFANN